MERVRAAIICQRMGQINSFFATVLSGAEDIPSPLLISCASAEDIPSPLACASAMHIPLKIAGLGEEIPVAAQQGVNHHTHLHLK